MNVFANFLLRNNTLRIRPRAVFTTAATLFPHYRKSIEEAFGCKVYDYYTCSEVSHIAAQCGESEGLHVSEENIMLEVVDGLEPVVEGEDGQILLTNLNGFGMPFIRYDVGDFGKILDDECACGRELSLIKIVGRQYEYFLGSDGSFTSFKSLQTVFEDVPIQDFQIVQEAPDDIIVKLVPKPEYTSAHTEFILKNIKMKGPARVQVELVDSIPLGSSGKIQRIVKSQSEPDYFAR
jgi:phenylacetate-CoA ligase